MFNRDPWETPERLPVFVYGTLRPGEHNADLWSHYATAVADGVARAFGVRVVHHNGSIPFAVATDDPTDFTVGALINVPDAAWRFVIHTFDALEGHPDLYERTRIVVDVDGVPVTAWAYLVDSDFLAGHDDVPGGDWVAFNAERREHWRRVKVVDAGFERPCDGASLLRRIALDQQAANRAASKPQE